ncbi:unnamed protein product [Hymenolepis diminuta]|uniref:Uncharacterized protein n=1 Tax=Hymenolepis diminuta TaxID=6216 RepID=A0A564Y502_HYMDI|nr:unnamed protein product [Hymenolepis diminuta]
METVARLMEDINKDHLIRRKVESLLDSNRAEMVNCKFQSLAVSDALRTLNMSASLIHYLNRSLDREIVAYIGGANSARTLFVGHSEIGQDKPKWGKQSLLNCI